MGAKMREVTMQNTATYFPQAAQAINFEKSGNIAWVKKSKEHFETLRDVTGKVGEALITAKERLRKHRRRHNAELAFRNSSGQKRHQVLAKIAGLRKR